MIDITRYRHFAVALAGLGLTGCVAAVPVQPVYTVIPGQGKTEANLHADDTACRVVPAATTVEAAVPVTEGQYYTCMASRGEAVIQEQAQGYPAYGAAPYVVPAYAAYPAYGYPYGYGYPYYGGYYGPYVGFGVGFGFGRFGGYGGYGGYRGFGGGYGGHRGYGGGYGGYRGYGGGYGGYHGGGYRR